MAEQAPRTLEEAQVRAAVRVREGRDAAVGPMAVEGELASARQPGVVAVGQRDPEPPGVLSHADERAERDHVVVRRALAVDAIRQHVGQEVLGEGRDGEVEERAGGIQLGKGERRDEERVELEGAVVPLGREPTPQIADLRGEAAGDAGRGAGRETGETRRRREHVPGIDPVLDAPAGHVARVGADRHRPDPRQDEALPGAEESRLCSLGEGVCEVEPVVELAPLDRPLPVVGEAGRAPVGLEPELEGDAVVREPSGARRFRHRAVPMLVGDDAEDRPRLRRLAHCPAPATLPRPRTIDMPSTMRPPSRR